MDAVEHIGDSMQLLRRDGLNQLESAGLAAVSLGGRGAEGPAPAGAEIAGCEVSACRFGVWRTG